MFNYHTSTRQILGDLQTPVSVYLRIRGLSPQSALMESSDYHGNENARSFIALQPLASIAIAHGKCSANYPDGQTIVSDCTSIDDCTSALEQFLGQFKVSGEKAEVCGLYGYTTFNAVRYFEQIPVKDETRDEHDAPDLLYILYKYVIVFDHFNNTMTLVELLADGETDTLERLRHRCCEGPASPYPFHSEGPVCSTLTDDEHRANIRRGIHHCLRGDVFQIVLSRRFCQRFTGDDFQLYRALRSINPSPYLFYFDFGGFRIFGSSPETHCRIIPTTAMAEGSSDDQTATGSKSSRFRAYIDPIAGTTRRTGNRYEDLQAAEYLRADPKENAEHVMLVDLARNDLSRNCHNVHVEFFKDMQFYSHVIHLVSRVSGTLDEQASPIRAFFDTFPAGTLSGAPKVRAMQLISEIEPHNRGAYGGCIGFLGLDGSLNQAITIRTFVSRGGELWFQAGGGIVAKSDVDYELQEVNNKLGALRRAILEAENL
ncbi:MAG: anthranilate synthase component I family protein [Bacteroidaceae bacterium]|nr:anthranilate synthase component I family protein [Bacteroidaceae bacterium]